MSYMHYLKQRTEDDLSLESKAPVVSIHRVAKRWPSLKLTIALVLWIQCNSIGCLYSPSYREEEFSETEHPSGVTERANSIY
jgi:hypothetical protein